MDDFITIKCPGCGNDMQLDSKTKSGTCTNCSSKVNYRDARSMPSHIVAEEEEKEQFANSATVTPNDPARELPDSDAIEPKKISATAKQKAGTIASIVMYSIVLLIIIIVVISFPGVADFLLVVAIMFVIQIVMNVIKLIRVSKGS